MIPDDRLLVPVYALSEEQQFDLRVRRAKRTIVKVFVILLVLALTAAVILAVFCIELKDKADSQQRQIVELNRQLQTLEANAAQSQQQEDGQEGENPPHRPTGFGY